VTPSEQSWPMAADLYGEMQLEAHPPARRRWRDYLPGILVTATPRSPRRGSPTIMPRRWC